MQPSGEYDDGDDKLQIAFDAQTQGAAIELRGNTRTRRHFAPTLCAIGLQPLLLTACLQLFCSLGTLRLFKNIVLHSLATGWH